jgi:uncharacterized protein YqjF (DUF2071 family)
MGPDAMKPFVSAVWSDLLIVSYAVPECTLKPYLPPGLTIDLHAGEAYVSIAAFRFRHTRVLGWSTPIPADLCDFPQLNLRFYARHERERGIIFLREFVPSPLVANMVRLCYNEPYHAAPLTCRTSVVDDLRRVRYDLHWGNARHAAAVTARQPACTPEPGSLGDFFTEQDWGFGRGRNGALTRFRVRRAPWREYFIEEYYLKLDFEAVFGPPWAFLQDRKPSSVVLFEGSAVDVLPNERYDATGYA